ncbi:hypothetical protein [Tropicimonas sp. S265A]|uniref:hypothetical protein n=1 Tax=Tropicimonas sp. S265A TaxID=3415134 RepID=UPI003C7B7AA5
MLDLAHAAKLRSEIEYVSQLKACRELQDTVSALRVSVQNARRGSRDSLDIEHQIKHENWAWKKIEETNSTLIEARVRLAELEHIHKKAAAKELVVKTLAKGAAAAERKARLKRSEYD